VGIPQHGFLLSRGILTEIDHPDAVRTTAFDINERGDILGAYAGAAGTRLYVLSSGVFTTIEVPGTLGTLGPGPAGSFAGINAKGEIVGAYTTRPTARFAVLSETPAGFSRRLTSSIRCLSGPQASTRKGTSWATTATSPAGTTAFCFGAEPRTGLPGRDEPRAVGPVCTCGG
jgi:uncharacterized membrane protein